PYTYRWNAQQTDADLVNGDGASDTFTVKDPRAPGGSRETRWRFMSRAECLRCHNAWAGEALTLNAMQLGGPPTRAAGNLSPSQRESTGAEETSELQRLVSLGLLKLKTSARESASLVNPYDDSWPLADRARSWLHVNCGTCHRNGAGGT